MTRATRGSLAPLAPVPAWEQRVRFNMLQRHNDPRHRVTTPLLYSRLSSAPGLCPMTHTLTVLAAPTVGQPQIQTDPLPADRIGGRWAPTHTAAPGCSGRLAAAPKHAFPSLATGAATGLGWGVRHPTKEQSWQSSAPDAVAHSKRFRQVSNRYPTPCGRGLRPRP